MRSNKSLTLCLAALFAFACSDRQSTKMGADHMEQNHDTIFPKGDKAPADTFTGTVYVHTLAARNEHNNFSVASVTFEPGARSFWHSHPAGQTILVTEGKGLYQEKGSTRRELNKGDAVQCPPDVEHWHGASPQSALTHVVITNYKGEIQVNWNRPVTDGEYSGGVE